MWFEVVDRPFDATLDIEHESYDLETPLHSIINHDLKHPQPPIDDKVGIYRTGERVPQL